METLPRMGRSDFAILLFLAVLFFGVRVRPLSPAANIPVMLFILVAGALMWLSVYYGLVWLRAGSTVIVTESGLRESSAHIHPLASTDLGGAPFQPMSLYMTGGAAYAYVSYADRHALFVPKASVKRFGKRCLLVHAPTQPLPGTFLPGLAPHETDQAARSSHSAFVPKDTHFVHFSMLNSLAGLDSQKLRENQAHLVDKYARLHAETRKFSHLGSKRFLSELRGLAAAARARPVRERVGKFFAGKNKEEEDEEERIS